MVAQGWNWPDTDILLSVGRKVVGSAEVSVVRTHQRGLENEMAVAQSSADKSVKFQSLSRDT